MTSLKPVSDRVETLDVIRGLAICGMFTVNMTADVFWADSFRDLSPGSADYIALLLVNLFASGKFITIFSFLFGIGFYVQAERRIAAGQDVPTFWLRRLAGLLMIGLVANALTIPAWILVDYSLFGIGLLLFYRLPPRWILAAATGCLAIDRLVEVIIPVYWPAPEQSGPAISMVLDAIHDNQAFIGRNGTFLAISSTTLLHMWEELTWWRYYLLDLDVFVIMLLGLYVARRGAVWNKEVRLALARKTAGWLLGIGTISAIGWVAIARIGPDDPSTHFRVFSSFLVWPFATSILGLGYAAAIVLLMERDGFRRMFVPFASIGRMVLTNYLFTGLVLAFISFPWGLGLYGEVYPFAGLMVAIGCLPFQALASRWWLANFAFGPFEWLWRSWTYGSPPALRRSAVVA
jgi:uncharacterized protein